VEEVYAEQGRDGNKIGKGIAWASSVSKHLRSLLVDRKITESRLVFLWWNASAIVIKIQSASGLRPLSSYGEITLLTVCRLYNCTY